MTRRNRPTVQSAVLVGLLGLAAPGVLGQTPGPAPAPPLSGVPQFAADPSWPVLPPEWRWGQVIGIFADRRGHVWTSTGGRISEWDREGRQLQSWDARGPDGNWSTIHGLFVDHNGFVWTNARESHLTLKFTPTGQVALVIGKFNETGGSNDTQLMGRPSEIWVDPADNEVFVADGYGNRRIIVFDGATGKYLRHWGAYGRPPIDPAGRRGGGGGGGVGQQAPPAAPPQQFSVPHGIAGSRDGLIYLADRANNRIQVFRQNGEFVRERILRPRCGAEEQATWAPKRPCGREAAFSVGFSHDGPQTYLYIADGGSHVVTIARRSDLEIVTEFGGRGVASGQLGRPHNLTVDPWGNIFVAEADGTVGAEPMTDPKTGTALRPGFRAQKFRFTGTR